MAGPIYIADPESCFRQAELDGLTAIFHIPSGMTHILAAPAPQIIEALAGAPADAGELARRLNERFEIEGGNDAMTARLAELEAAGLVSRI
jgi:PqqD family protein of HPr-rel-A system